MSGVSYDERIRPVMKREEGIPVEVSCPFSTPLQVTDNDEEEKQSKAVGGGSDSSNSSSSSSVDPNRVQMRTLDIGFAYEFAIVDPNEAIDEVMEQDVPRLESFILYLVAEATGLMQCDFDRQNINLWSGDITNTAGEQQPYLISLSSEGKDSWDSLVDGCEYLLDIPTTWICVPIDGQMSLQYWGTEADSKAVENFVVSYIQREIDSNSIRKDGVQDSMFLGTTRIVRGVPSERDSNAASDNNNNNAITRGETPDTGSSYIGLASGLASAFVVIILVVYVAFARRKKKQKSLETQEIKQPNSSDDDINDLQPDGQLLSLESVDDEEQPPVLFLDSGDTPHRGRSGFSSNDTQPDIDSPQAVKSLSSLTTVQAGNGKAKKNLGHFHDDAHHADMINAPPKSPLLSPGKPPKSPRKSPTSYEQRNRSAEQDLVDAAAVLSNLTSMESDDSSSNNNAEVVSVNSASAATQPIVDVLPPKPPGGSSKPPPGGSKTIKRNRRKKKKKKQKLIRVNSRESINEMETINEESEDISVGSGTEEGSEYSWYSTDDEDSSRPGSRDPSPARSRSRSRDPSPLSLRSGNRSRDPSPLSRSRSNSTGELIMMETIDMIPSPIQEDKESKLSRDKTTSTNWV